MGQGEEVKTRNEPEVEIQERGEIFFFYRPKVNKEEAHSADEVQRLYIVLRPESGERPVEQKQSPDSGKEGSFKKEGKEHQGGHGAEEVNIEKEPLVRFLVMGKKSLPDPHRRSTPHWGFVEMVTTKIDDVKTALLGEEYDTATRGHRRRYPARAVGEGIYRILRHKSGGSRGGMHTHLIYKLELPGEDKANEPQESLNIEREGSFLLQIKNPDQNPGGSGGRGGDGGFRGIQSKRKAMFPAGLQGQFGNKRYSAADPPDFLNYEGCEFLLIAASDDIEEELGLELKTEEEECEGEEEGGSSSSWSSCSDLVKTFGEKTLPTAPLFQGTWA